MQTVTMEEAERLLEQEAPDGHETHLGTDAWFDRNTLKVHTWCEQCKSGEMHEVAGFRSAVSGMLSEKRVVSF